MGKLFFFALLAGVATTSLVRPWVGVVAAYVVAILTPQAVWWWHFEGVRPAFWILLPTLAGFLFAAARGDYAMRSIYDRRIAYLLVLWTCFVVSYTFGPYADVLGPYRFTDPSWALETLSKLFLLYLVASFCINDERKLRILLYSFAGCAVYLIYWANERYLSGQVFGRLAGPVDVFGQGAYGDENAFGLLFVVAQPFLWYLGFATGKRLVRWMFWLAIPFGWHAVFLTASRGALVGLVVVTLLMTLRSRRKLFSVMLVPALLLAYAWQAGDLMKSRADSIEEYRSEVSAATRLEAWEAAVGMIKAYPLTGVGLASFGPAFPDFSENSPREAHNTFLQIAAESGVVAGMMYLFLVLGSIAELWRRGNHLKRGLSAGQVAGSSTFLYHANEASLIGLTGLTVCSLFLSLQVYEMHYFVLLVAQIVLFLGIQEARRGSGSSSAEAQSLPDLSPQPRPQARPLG